MDGMADQACAFCAKLAEPSWPGASELVWQFPSSVAFLGTWQFYEGYCVVVHREHHTELHQLPPTARHVYLDEMVAMAWAIETVFQPRKLNYELLGNQVPHLHWHLFPRHAIDPDHLKPVWVAIDRAEQDSAIKKQLAGPDVNRADVIHRLRGALTSRGAPRR